KKTQKTKISFPFRLYFQQLFATDIYVKFINPLSFWRRYRINHLETCREIDTARYLEGCNQLEWQSKKLPNHKSSKSISKISTERNISWKNTAQNKVLISQPSFELKYRGVTYRSNRIVAVNANQIEIKSELLTSDSAKQLPRSNKNNSSQKSNNIS
ncbi:hypothetical protein, partial [Hyella patelloides]|uniref:hypothetical protein n=1 Tax=Hyella patelloides TaxID=1982969 RepID=UPI001643BDB1